MKNILFALALFTSWIFYAQHTVKGIMSPNIDTDWVILYKIEGTKQVFINNTTIKVDSVEVNGRKEAVGTFEIKLPSYAEPGSYRATYRLEGASFVDFFYNKEDVTFMFNPEYPNQSITFSESAENILFKEYVDTISLAQQKLDSIQIAVLQNPELNLEDAYKKAFNNVNVVQEKYLKISKDMFVKPFINATLRINSPTVLKSTENYMANMKSTFFDNMDFNDKTLINSSFLVDRILDYVFYINYSDDQETQQKLYKESVDEVLSKIKNDTYKKGVIEFLIEQFEQSKNLELIDYLFNNHYSKLPLNLQDDKFKSEKVALLAAEIGRIAPDFSWKENGRNFKLSTLNDAQNYVLVFWSTSCSHCLREVPKLHTFIKDKNNTKVIAFALENDASVWENYIKTNLSGWHNVLGLNKWENKTARTYQVFSTPSYFILDKNKKIIAKPNDIEDVKAFLEKL